MFDSGVIWLGEIRCQSLLGAKLFLQLAITESQISTGDDLILTLCVVWRMKLKSNES